jgi:hypothetical protein
MWSVVARVSEGKVSWLHYVYLKIPFIRFVSVSPYRRVQYGLVGYGGRNSILSEKCSEEKLWNKTFQ